MIPQSLQCLVPQRLTTRMDAAKLTSKIRGKIWENIGKLSELLGYVLPKSTILDWTFKHSNTNKVEKKKCGPNFPKILVGVTSVTFDPKDQKDPKGGLL